MLSGKRTLHLYKSQSRPKLGANLSGFWSTFTYDSEERSAAKGHGKEASKPPSISYAFGVISPVTHRRIARAFPLFFFFFVGGYRCRPPSGSTSVYMIGINTKHVFYIHIFTTVDLLKWMLLSHSPFLPLSRTVEFQSNVPTLFHIHFHFASKELSFPYFSPPQVLVPSNINTGLRHLPLQCLYRVAGESVGPDGWRILIW